MHTEDFNKDDSHRIQQINRNIELTGIVATEKRGAKMSDSGKFGESLANQTIPVKKILSQKPYSKNPNYDSSSDFPFE